MGIANEVDERTYSKSGAANPGFTEGKNVDIGSVCGHAKIRLDTII